MVFSRKVHGSDLSEAVELKPQLRMPPLLQRHLNRSLNSQTMKTCNFLAEKETLRPTLSKASIEVHKMNLVEGKSSIMVLFYTCLLWEVSFETKLFCGATPIIPSSAARLQRGSLHHGGKPKKLVFFGKSFQRRSACKTSAKLAVLARFGKSLDCALLVFSIFFPQAGLLNGICLLSNARWLRLNSMPCSTQPPGRELKLPKVEPLGSSLPQSVDIFFLQRGNLSR